MKPIDWLRFLRQYGPVPRNDNMYDETIQRSARHHGILPIVFEHPAHSEIVNCFNQATTDPVSVILTGTAGDGKTHLCRQVWKSLKGDDAEWASDNPYLTMEFLYPKDKKAWPDTNDRDLYRAVKIHFIRDLSGWAPQQGAEWDPEKEELLQKFSCSLFDGESNEIFLIAANDGQLVESWRRLKKTEAVKRARQVFEDLLVEDRQNQAGVRLKFFNLSRASSAQLFDRALDAFLNHLGWDEVKREVPAENDLFGPKCPIRRNYELLQTPLVRSRLRSLLELCDHNGLHVPIRQILLLLTNSVLGHPDVRDHLMLPADVPKIISAGTVSKASIYNNIFGGNLSEIRRQSITIFDYFERFQIGHETSNRVDNILIFGQDDSNLGSYFTEFVANDPFYGADSRFYAAKREYIEGTDESEDVSREFLQMLISQRRGLFFKIPKESESELNLWELAAPSFGWLRLRRQPLPRGGQMTSDQLIGKVAACYLRDRLTEDDSTGVARYLLDCLTAEQTAAIAKTILEDSSLAQLVEIKLPVHFVGNHGLPPAALTEERTTYFRNAACEKSALLVANTGDDEEQSLKELVPIGAQQLQAHPELWVNLAAEGLPITEQHQNWWIKALQGLLEVRSFALDRLADYVLQTRQAIKDGQPILFALGVAFPALHVPRDSAFFCNLDHKTAGHLSKWKVLYAQAIKRRACYLVKQTPSQALLLEEDLLGSFSKVQDIIPEALHPTIKAFIEADSGWNMEAAELAGCEWELVKPLFDGLKREQFNLGKATLEFYDERDTDLLTTDERDYLARLRDNKRSEAQDEDEDFYRRHRNELKEQPALKVRWDRFIFGTPIETEDFLLGVALCLEWLFDQDIPSSKRRLKITCDRRTKRDLKELNEDVGLFFVRRYRGLKALFGNRLSWDIGELMSFEALSDQWRRATKPYRNLSVAKSALQLKFYLDLEVELSTGATETHSKQLLWTYNPSAIASEFPGDWSRLAEHPLVYCCVNREPVSGKGRYQSLDLRNVRSLYPAYGQDRGSFVATYKKDADVSLIWPVNLSKAQEQGLISEQIATKLLGLFQSFQQSYQSAVKGFMEEGLAHDQLVKQAEDYGALLHAISKDARGDSNRESLLRLLLQIGTVIVNGGRVTGIVAPWQPLRLAAIANKAIQISSLVRYLLTADSVFFGDPPLFFKELEQELSHPFYPEIVLGWHDKKPELLSLTDHHLDYSLHESPVISNDGFDDTNESPSETSLLILDLTKRFLSLYPHERANLSVILYNCDSARLPYALVDKMNELHEDEEDMRCQIILRHRDGVKLRDLYEKIIESSDVDADSFVSSEAAKDFMARLRIGIIADQAPVPDPKDGPPADIVFLQDVIARHAGLEWYLEACNPMTSATLIPARWSRRRPSAVDDMKSVVYLCCPIQTQEGWSFITALTTFIKGDWDGVGNKRLLPARKLDFNDTQTASIFKEIHNLGNWVVNYDELLDRRQLLNQNVKVIRYKQGATQGRNILISSTAPLSLLRTMVFGRVKDLNLELTDLECRELAERFINDANEISGDIVLRAAKRGRNASELMGVVLSRYMIRHELGTGRRFGWYFLDDYAEWLGQREEQIADILALTPEQTHDGKLQLAVIISEAKYIDAASLATKRKESQKQLRDTVRRINDAIFGDPKRLDRDLWLSRFSDLMLNGIQFPANSPIDLAAWRRAVREGECAIHLRGYSHIFVSGPSDSPECSDFAAVAETEQSYQEVYSRTRLRELVLGYWKNSNPTPIRKTVANTDIWKEQIYQRPSDRVQIIQSRQSSDEPPSEGGATATTTPSKPKSPTPSQPTKPSMTPPTDADQPNTTLTAATGSWAYPKISQLLTGYQGGTHDSAADAEWLKQVENLCKGALQQFQFQSKLLNSTLTPNAALLKFQGSANLTVEQVLRRRSEFLTTHKLNVISVRAEPGVVAIAIARLNRRVLHLPEVWKGWNPDCSNGNHDLLIAIKEEDSSHLILSPKLNAPHTLIAGSTGSGKSVLMQNIILGIACTNTPDQAKIVLVDPKLGVDYFAFEGLPHLQGGIIDNQDNAILKLNELVVEMNRRYGVLKENKVSNIFELNKKTNATERLPFLWIIHDEFAEWMMTEEYAEAVSDVVGRLGVKARAAGISLVFAAQRPDANVMPMQLRANLGNRLVLRVDGEGTSEIALGEKGAERLLGKGHLAAKLEGEPTLIFAQVPFVDSNFLSDTVKLVTHET